jgi:hypothetical protein
MGKVGSRILVSAGALLTIAAGWIAFGTVMVLWRAGATPSPTTVADARDGAWVVLQDATLRCDSRIVERGATFFVGANPDGKVPFLVQLAGERGCDPAALEGVFLPGRFTRAYLKERIGVALPEGEDLKVFTESLTPKNQRALLWRTLVFVALGLLLLVPGVRALRRSRSGAP